MLYYLVLTYYFFKEIMCLDVDFVSKLDIWGPKYAWVNECVILGPWHFWEKRNSMNHYHEKNGDFSHTKGHGSWQMCEINFVISSITIYNIWCLLWYLLHWNYNLTYHILLGFLFYVINPNKLLQLTLVEVRPYGEQLY